MRLKLLITLILVASLCACSSRKPDNAGNGWFSPLEYKSIDAYNDFVNTNKLPANFVFYDDIKNLGTFYRLWFYPDNGNLNYICYELIDENACTIQLTFSFVQDVSFPEETLNSYSDSLGVRRLSTNESGALVRDQIAYHYEDGYLKSISFSASGRLCTLELLEDGKLGMLSDYPTDGERTFTAMLLSQNPADARSAVDALCRNIPPTVEIICMWTTLCVLVVTTAGVTTFFLIRRKKKVKEAPVISE